MTTSLQNFRLLGLGLVILTLGLFAISCGDADSGNIEVLDAQFRTTPNDLGAGYLTIANSTDEPITLRGASSPEVTRIELHESMMQDGVMRMTARPEGFTVGAGEEVVLAPGGKHLMLFEPEPTGDQLEITLDFAAHALPAAGAVALIEGFAQRVETPLRQLL